MRNRSSVLKRWERAGRMTLHARHDAFLCALFSVLARADGNAG